MSKISSYNQKPQKNTFSFQIKLEGKHAFIHTLPVYYFWNEKFPIRYIYLIKMKLRTLLLRKISFFESIFLKRSNCFDLLKRIFLRWIVWLKKIGTKRDHKEIRSINNSSLSFMLDFWFTFDTDMLKNTFFSFFNARF